MLPDNPNEERLGGQETLTSTPSPTPTPVSGISLKVEFLNNVVIALGVVLFLGFAGMFVATTTIMFESWQNRAESYSNLQDEVQTQNAKIDSLITEIKRQNISTTSLTTNP